MIVGCAKIPKGGYEPKTVEKHSIRRLRPSAKRGLLKVAPEPN